MLSLDDDPMHCNEERWKRKLKLMKTDLRRQITQQSTPISTDLIACDSSLSKGTRIEIVKGLKAKGSTSSIFLARDCRYGIIKRLRDTM